MRCERSSRTWISLGCWMASGTSSRWLPSGNPSISWRSRAFARRVSPTAPARVAPACFRQEQLQELRGQLRGPADVLGNLGFLDLKWHKWQFFWTPPQGEIQGPDLVESKRPSSSMPNWKLEVVDAFRETQAVSTRKCRTSTPRWTSLPSLRRSLLF